MDEDKTVRYVWLLVDRVSWEGCMVIVWMEIYLVDMSYKMWDLSVVIDILMNFNEQLGGFVKVALLNLWNIAFLKRYLIEILLRACQYLCH